MSVYLNCIEQIFASIFAITVCSSISVVALVVGITIRIANSALGLKLCAVTSMIKNSWSIIKKNNERKYGKIVFLTKTMLVTTEGSTFKSLIHSDLVMVNLF